MIDANISLAETYARQESFINALPTPMERLMDFRPKMNEWLQDKGPVAPDAIRYRECNLSQPNSRMIFESYVPGDPNSHDKNIINQQNDDPQIRIIYQSGNGEQIIVADRGLEGIGEMFAPKAQSYQYPNEDAPELLKSGEIQDGKEDTIRFRSSRIIYAHGNKPAKIEVHDLIVPRAEVGELRKRLTEKKGRD